MGVGAAAADSGCSQLLGDVAPKAITTKAWEQALGKALFPALSAAPAPLSSCPLAPPKRCSCP